MIFVPELMLVLVAKSVHVPVLLLLHVAVIVSLSVSLQITYSVGMGHIPVAPFVGDGPLCVGALFVVKL